jgi:hypothetical protein
LSCPQNDRTVVQKLVIYINIQISAMMQSPSALLQPLPFLYPTFAAWNY